MPEKQTYGIPDFDRTVTTTPKTFRCKDCGQKVTEDRYPGPPPSVCQTCQADPERQRRLARERKRAQRERERAINTGIRPAPLASEAKSHRKIWDELGDNPRATLIEVATAAGMKKRGQPTHYRFNRLVQAKLIEVVSVGKSLTTFTLTDAGKDVVMSAPDDYRAPNGFYPLPQDIKKARDAIKPPPLVTPPAAVADDPPVPEAAPVEPVDKRQGKALAAWQGLNGRQQHYLNVIYDCDQEQEDDRREAGARGDWDDTPASEWRWIDYDSKHGGETRLKQNIGKKNIDPGTGSTFSALEERGLIETGGERVEGAFGHFNILRVKITKEGRAAVRAGKNIQTDRAPAGLLAESTWRALKLLYEAGDKGLSKDNRDRYEGISWQTSARLQNHPGGEGLMKYRDANPGAKFSYDRDTRAHITPRGKQIYEQRLAIHQKAYPALYPPLPQFLDGYKTVPTRKQVPVHLELSEERREVLAVIAAGLSYPADSRDNINKRKVARALVEVGLLAEVQHEPDHRKTRWRLTDAGLKLIRGDDDLQRRVTHWLK